MYGTHYTTAQETVMGSDLQVLQLHNKDKVWCIFNYVCLTHRSAEYMINFMLNIVLTGV